VVRRLGFHGGRFAHDLTRSEAIMARPSSTHWAASGGVARSR
jgi:hypothetical protein